MKESQNIEWKETWNDEYLKWICGFANAHGGKIGVPLFFAPVLVGDVPTYFVEKGSCYMHNVLRVCYPQINILKKS